MCNFIWRDKVTFKTKTFSTGVAPMTTYRWGDLKSIIRGMLWCALIGGYT